MRGIDISSWQAGIDLEKVLNSVEFCIIKATGGSGYVNPYCDEWVQLCKDLNKPWGFYHFANDDGWNDAATEANYFINACWNYFGDGIPILDWETDLPDEWINTFVNIVHSETGIWPWIYGNPWRFSENIEQNCGRWVASYPDIYQPSLYVDLPEPPYVDGLMCAWQFASDCQVKGYNGNLDASVFYGDVEAWNKYAGKSTYTPEPKPDPDPQPETIILYDCNQFRIDLIWK